jgi:HK97 family phage major capsid protein
MPKTADRRRGAAEPTSRELLQEVHGQLEEALPRIEGQVEDFGTRLDRLEATYRSGTALEGRGGVRLPNFKQLGGLLPGVEDELAKEEFSLFQVVRGFMGEGWGRGFELEVMKECYDAKEKKGWRPRVDPDVKEKARREMIAKANTSQADVTATGGLLIPTQALPEFVELLRAETVVMEAGIRVLSGLTGIPVELPKQTGGASANMVPESGPGPESDAEFGQISLTPKQMMINTRVSRRMARLSDPAIEAILREDMARVGALKLDQQVLRGTGVGGEVLGIVNTTGIGTFNASNTVLTFGDLVDIVGVLEDANALPANARTAFITSPIVRRNLLKERVQHYTGQTTQLGYVFPPILSREQLAEQTGHPWHITTQVPVNLGAGSDQTELIFGNMIEGLIGMWDGMEVEVSTQATTADGRSMWARNEVALKLTHEFDFAVRHPESFVLASAIALS